MRATRTCRRLLPALVTIAWLACASGPAPRDHFYRLEAAAPKALASPALAGTVEVDRLRVEAVSHGRRMLYRDASQSGEIGQHAYHHWVDPPSVMLQDQLVRYMRLAGAAETVVTPAVHVESDYLVSGRIIRMERILSGGEQRVAVEIELMLTRQEGRDLLVLETYREERVAPGAGVDQSVAAYEQAITAIFERFLADIPSS
jgi:ABC-type uncharacterized transport system auxiliary subunit